MVVPSCCHLPREGPNCLVQLPALSALSGPLVPLCTKGLLPLRGMGTHPSSCSRGGPISSIQAPCTALCTEELLSVPLPLAAGRPELPPAATWPISPLRPLCSTLCPHGLLPLAGMGTHAALYSHRVPSALSRPCAPLHALRGSCILQVWDPSLPYASSGPSVHQSVHRCHSSLHGRAGKQLLAASCSAETSPRCFWGNCSGLLVSSTSFSAALLHSPPIVKAAHVRACGLLSLLEAPPSAFKQTNGKA